MPVKAPQDAAEEALEHAKGHCVAEQLSPMAVAVWPDHSPMVEALCARGLAEGEVAAAEEGPHPAGAGAREARNPWLGAGSPGDRDACVEGEVDGGEVQAVLGGLLELELDHLLSGAPGGAREASAVVGGTRGSRRLVRGTAGTGSGKLNGVTMAVFRSPTRYSRSRCCGVPQSWVSRSDQEIA